MRFPVHCSLAAAGFLLAAGCRAGGDAALSEPVAFASAAPVAAAILDDCRGGFVTPSGLAVTLGIERLVSVDGQVLARSAVQFGELGRLLQSGQAPRPSHQMQDGGAGLSIRMGPSPVDGTFIQNSLDNRMIGTTTVIQASVDANGALQAMHFQSTLANALQLTVGGR